VLSDVSAVRGTFNGVPCCRTKIIIKISFFHDSLARLKRAEFNAFHTQHCNVLFAAAAATENTVKVS
jgi:hypothetical protein